MNENVINGNVKFRFTPALFLSPSGSQFTVGSFFFGGAATKSKNKTWKRKRKGRAARWTSQCFDSLPTAQYSRGSSLSLSDILLRPIYVCVSPAFPLLVCVPLLCFSPSSLAFFSLNSSHKFLSSLPRSSFSFKF